MEFHHGLKELNGIDAFCHCGHQRQEGEKFGRMFDLPPLATLPSHLKALGEQDDGVRGELTVTQRLRSEALLDRAFSGKTSGLQLGGALSPC